MLLHLLSGLLVHRMIPSNIVSLFRVFTLVVVAAMASPLLSAIGEFEPVTETFTVYSDRLDQFFVANNIGSYPTGASEAIIAAAEKKIVTVMISVIGKKTYSILRDLCRPVNPKDKTFEQLSELLQQHFKPKRLEVAESYRFHRCFQEDNETVSVYSAHLRHLASTCHFGEFLNCCLRDLFVCGIRNPATRKKLLSEDRTFQQALEVAVADEIAVKESVQAQQQLTQSVNSVSENLSVSSTLSVDSVSKNSAVLRSSGENSRVPPLLRQGIRPNSPSPPQSNSYACGTAGHVRSKCKFRNATCRNCNTRGHIARACRKNGVNAVCVEEEAAEDPLLEEDELYMVYDVNAISRSEISVALKIQNNNCSMQLDTGCALSLAPISRSEIHQGTGASFKILTNR